MPVFASSKDAITEQRRGAATSPAASLSHSDDVTDTAAASVLHDDGDREAAHLGASLADSKLAPLGPREEDDALEGQLGEKDALAFRAFDPYEGVPFSLDELGHEAGNQLTVRAVLLGSVLGLLIAASNVYLGLKTGFTFAASLFGAILGFGGIQFLQTMLPHAYGGGPTGPRETCTVQSTATAAGSLSGAFVAAIPAMYQLGLLGASPKEDFGRLITFTVVSAFYGAAFAPPLRNFFILRLKLVFPTPTATAITIKSLHSVGGARRARIQTYVLGAAFAAALVWCVLDQYAQGILYEWHIFYWLYQWGWKKALVVDNWGWWIQTTPAFHGAGMLAGLNASCSFFLGVVLTWAIIGPSLIQTGQARGRVLAQLDGVTRVSYTSLSWQPGQDLNTASPRYWALWAGILIMFAASAAELAMNAPAIYRATRTAVMDTYRTMRHRQVELTPEEEEARRRILGDGVPPRARDARLDVGRRLDPLHRLYLCGGLGAVRTASVHHHPGHLARLHLLLCRAQRVRHDGHQPAQCRRQGVAAHRRGRAPRHARRHERAPALEPHCGFHRLVGGAALGRHGRRPQDGPPAPSPPPDAVLRPAARLDPRHLPQPGPVRPLRDELPVHHQPGPGGHVPVWPAERGGVEADCDCGAVAQLARLAEQRHHGHLSRAHGRRDRRGALPVHPEAVPRLCAQLVRRRPRLCHSADVHPHRHGVRSRLCPRVAEAQPAAVRPGRLRPRRRLHRRRGHRGRRERHPHHCGRRGRSVRGGRGDGVRLRGGVSHLLIARPRLAHRTRYFLFLKIAPGRIAWHGMAFVLRHGTARHVTSTPPLPPAPPSGRQGAPRMYLASMYEYLLYDAKVSQNLNVMEARSKGQGRGAPGPAAREDGGRARRGCC